VVTIEATVGLDQPGKMLLRLCKHFEHKLKVTYSDTQAHLEFFIGSCDAQVNEDALHFICRPNQKIKMMNSRTSLKDTWFALPIKKI